MQCAHTDEAAPAHTHSPCVVHDTPCCNTGAALLQWRVSPVSCGTGYPASAHEAGCDCMHAACTSCIPCMVHATAYLPMHVMGAHQLPQANGNACISRSMQDMRHVTHGSLHRVVTTLCHTVRHAILICNAVSSSIYQAALCGASISCGAMQ